MQKYIGNLKTPLNKNQGCISIDYKEYSDIGIKGWYIIPKKPDNRYKFNPITENWELDKDIIVNKRLKENSEKFLEAVSENRIVTNSYGTFELDWIKDENPSNYGGLLRVLKKSVANGTLPQDYTQRLRLASSREDIFVTIAELDEIVFDLEYQRLNINSNLYNIKHDNEKFIEDENRTIQELENFVIEY